eukprot:6209173-Ditylum_brightwellii.AAC.1
MAKCQVKSCRNKMTSMLNPDDCLLFESPEPDQQPVWLRREVVKEKWGNACVWKNKGTCVVMIHGGGHIYPGIESIDYNIEVEWQLPISQCTKYIVHVGFEMTRVLGTRSQAPRQQNMLSSQCDNYMYDMHAGLQTAEGD